MNKQELCELFTDCLKKKLLGEQYNGREIADINVEISEEYLEGEECGGSFDKIDIRVKTLSLMGKTSRWEDYYIL